MSFNEFLQRVEKIEGIVEANEILRDNSANLRREHFIKSVDDFSKDKAELERENRLLKIGILGRVKAGKSSFLNALLFNGKNILPKAATPMTASLTILEYAKNPSFSVEFYSQKDLDEIATEARKYESKLQECINEKFAELKEREAKKVMNPAQIDESKLRQNAKDIVESDFKLTQEALFACYEQNELIKNSGISLSQLEANKDFSGDLEAIRAKLSDYVGESGKFMPFTKSITLRLDNEFLQNVQIVDTPGLNDPVPSRSARTLEFLDKCDAALVLSPAGQFLNASDVELLDMLDKNATTKIYFVASRADSQLHGHIKDNSNGNLDSAISLIQDELSSSISQKLRDGGIESKIMQTAMREDIILSSSICANFALRDESELDGDESHALGLLKKNYPNDFSPSTKASSFAKLANMDKLKSIFDSLKTQKESILEQRLADFLSTRQKQLEAYQSALIDTIKEQIALLEASDLEKLQAQEVELKATKRNAEFALNEVYEDLCDELVKDLRENLKDRKERFFRDLESKSEGAQGTDSKSYEVDDSSWYNPFSWGRTKTKTKVFATYKAGQIRGVVKDTCAELENLLSTQSKDFIKEWQKKAQKAITTTLLKEVDSIHLDRIVLSKSIKDAFSTIQYPEISYESQIPESINGARGTLQGYEANSFIGEVESYIADFKSQVTKDITNFADTIEQNLKGVKLGDSIFGKIISEIERLKDDLANKEARLKAYKNLQNTLEQIR
ncbi:dynamin family protein [Helicobacter sp. T3_23-1059]